MKRFLRWIPAVLILTGGAYEFAPDAVSRISRAVRPEYPEEEIVRLRHECVLLRNDIEEKSDALNRMQRHYERIRRGDLRPQALQQIQRPMYALREDIQTDKETLAAKESRIAFLVLDQETVLTPRDSRPFSLRKGGTP